MSIMSHDVATWYTCCARAIVAGQQLRQLRPEDLDHGQVRERPDGDVAGGRPVRAGAAGGLQRPDQQRVEPQDAHLEESREAAGAVNRQNSEASALVATSAATWAPRPACCAPPCGAARTARRAPARGRPRRGRPQARATAVPPSARQDHRHLERHLHAGANELVQHHRRPHRPEPPRRREHHRERRGGRHERAEHPEVGDQPAGRPPASRTRSRARARTSRPPPRTRRRAAPARARSRWFGEGRGRVRGRGSGRSSERSRCRRRAPRCWRGSGTGRWRRRTRPAALPDSPPRRRPAGGTAQRRCTARREIECASTGDGAEVPRSIALVPGRRGSGPIRRPHERPGKDLPRSSNRRRFGSRKSSSLARISRPSCAYERALCCS